MAPELHYDAPMSAPTIDVRADAAGLFGPDSAAWLVDRELVVLAGGSCALLLQAAHPVVAAGVAEHSTYATDPWGRLMRTLGSSFDVVFGTRSRAEATIARVNAIHASVRGRLPTDGTPYSALDPEALLWVHATLIDTALRVYARFVRPLSRAQEQAYHDEAGVVAGLLGVPADLVPPTVAELRAWMDTMIADGRVVVTPTAREIARTVLYPWPWVPRVAWDAAHLVSLATLRPAIRRQYGIGWSDDRERGIDRLAALSRGALPPAAVAAAPRAPGPGRRATGRSGRGHDPVASSRRDGSPSGSLEVARRRAVRIRGCPREVTPEPRGVGKALLDQRSLDAAAPVRRQHGAGSEPGDVVMDVQARRADERSIELGHEAMVVGGSRHVRLERHERARLGRRQIGRGNDHRRPGADLGSLELAHDEARGPCGRWPIARLEGDVGGGRVADRIGPRRLIGPDPSGHPVAGEVVDGALEQVRQVGEAEREVEARAGEARCRGHGQVPVVDDRHIAAGQLSGAPDGERGCGLRPVQPAREQRALGAVVVRW